MPWLELMNLGGSLKLHLLQCELWTESAFPRRIVDIENNTRWREMVHAFYTGRYETNGTVIFFIVVLILFVVVPVFVVSAFAEFLKSKVISTLFTQLLVCQVVVGIISIFWVFGVLFSWLAAKRRLSNLQHNIPDHSTHPKMD